MPTQHHQWDLFISHAGEDKTSIARPLATLLGKKGLKVWYDEFALTLGDSLRRSIDQGLRGSKYGLIILSPSFFQKEWPQKELDGLTAREIDGAKVILPIWHDIDRQMVLKYSPVLADRLAVSTKDGLEAVALAVLHALKAANPVTVSQRRTARKAIRNGKHPMAKGLPVISSGCLALDLALDIGGYARGHMVEVYGPDSSGKTAIALSLVGEAAKLGEISTFVDGDATISQSSLARHGIDSSKVNLLHPSYLEEAFFNVLDHADKYMGGAIVFDGLSSLLPKDYYDNNSAHAEEGVLHRRIVERGIQQVRNAIRKAGAVFLCTNRVVDKVGVLFGNPEDTPWPTRTIKDLMSVRMDIRRIGGIRLTDSVIVGNHTRVKVIKTRFGPPYREAEFDLMYGEGIDNYGCVLDLAADKRILTRRGSWWFFRDKRLGLGRDNAKEALRNNHACYVDIVREVMSVQ
jgi:recombination protein RecA